MATGDESEDKDLSSILVLAPALEQPELGTLQRLEHECSLRDELDPEWAVRPIELSYHWDRLVLVLEDPGGKPLEQLLGHGRDELLFVHGTRGERELVPSVPDMGLN